MSAVKTAITPVAYEPPEPSHTGNLIRLNRLLDGSENRFALVIAIYNQPAYRDRLIENLPSSRTPNGPALLDANTLADIGELENALQRDGKNGSPLHLIGLDRWLDSDGSHPAGLERIRGFNRHRDYIAKRCTRPLVLWLLEHQARHFAREAPDAWEWRAGVLDFAIQAPTASIPLPQALDLFVADKEQRSARIAELREFIARHEGQLNDREHKTLWDELGDIQESSGNWEAAMKAYEQGKAACERLDDRRGAAIAAAKMAKLHWRQGDPQRALDELYAISVEFEDLGDIRSQAVRQCLIADILQDRGCLDEALRIYQKDCMPVYQELGDVHALVICKSRIADILLTRGQLDEALRIYQELLPVYQRLDHMRSIAITQGQIAKILLARGQLDEALRICQKDALPIYQRLGDVRSVAITQWQIADIFLARGQLDEALRILQDDVLPIVQTLGYVGGLAICKGRIADILNDLGQIDKALHILQEEALPIFQTLDDAHSIAVCKGRIADILQNRGQLDEALRIRQEDELPVYQKLGDMRSMEITQDKIDNILQIQGQLDETLRIHPQDQA